jgi:DNA-binding HxlR family transcriptional regulator
VTPKVLTETLRSLERDGLLTRTVFQEHPPRVEYELTALGHSLLGPMDAVCGWARENLGTLLAARAAHLAPSGQERERTAPGRPAPSDQATSSRASR